MSFLYSVTCNDCWEDLNYEVNLDGSDDLSLDIDPCENCKKDAYNKGYEEGIEEGKKY